MKTTEETKVTSQDWVFIFFLILAVFMGINYLLRNNFLEIAKVLVIIDLYLMHYINMIFLSVNLNIEYLEKMDIFFNYMKDGLFDNLKYMLKYEKEVELKIFNYYNGNAYSYFQEIFNDFYYFNTLIILGIFAIIFKLTHFKKNMDGTKIYNKPLMAYYDKIIKTGVRKGIGKNKYVVTNDHQPPGISHNPDYIEASVKLTLLNNNSNFWSEIKKLREKQERLKKVEILNTKTQKLTANLNDNKLKNNINLSKDSINLSKNLISKDGEIKEENEKLTEIELDKLKNAEIIEKYYLLPPQYNKKRLVDVKKNIDNKRKSLSDGETIKLSEVEKEVAKYYDILNKDEKKRTPQEIQFLKQTKVAYERNIEDFNSKYDEGIFLTPSYYILHPKEGKVPKKTNPNSNEKVYETPGIDIIIELLYKYILDSYEPAIKAQISELKGINKKLNTKNPLEAQTYELNMQIIEEFERQLDENDKKSRVNALMELSEKHKYEETYVLSMWEYANTITNMPTGPLVKLKWINPVLWYAFTSLKRPSVFLIGTPIYVMFLYEKEATLNKKEVNETFKAENFSDYIKETGIDKILKEKDIA